MPNAFELQCAVYCQLAQSLILNTFISFSFKIGVEHFALCCGYYCDKTYIMVVIALWCSAKVHNCSLFCQYKYTAQHEQHHFLKLLEKHESTCCSSLKKLCSFLTWLPSLPVSACWLLCMAFIMLCRILQCVQFSLVCLKGLYLLNETVCIICEQNLYSP